MQNEGPIESPEQVNLHLVGFDSLPQCYLLVSNIGNTRH